MQRAHFLRLGRQFGALALTATVIFAAAIPARAEIDPKYYREWQERATEALVVRVTAVKTSVASEKHSSGSFALVHTRVDASATVEKVERTGTGLKPGDAIRIQYVSTRPSEPMPGPRPVPVLKRGEAYPAFLLAVSKGLYAPAAKGASFEPLITQ